MTRQEELLRQLREYIERIDAIVLAVHYLSKRSTLDSIRMDYLENRGVDKIYFDDGGEINPTGAKLRCVVDHMLAAQGIIVPIDEVDS